MENENYCINYCINCGRKLRRHELITCDICEDLSVITNQYVNTYIEADSMESLKEKCAMCDMDNDKQFHEKVEDMMKGDDYEYKGI